MTRVDNAAIASQLLGEVEEILNGQPTSEPLVKATQAVAEATLALVEQQRIANLMTLSDYSLARWGNYAGEAGGMGVLFLNPDTESGNMRLHDDIAQALGIRNRS